MININNQKLLDRYLLICKSKGLTERTIDAFKTDLRVFFEYIGDRDLKSITHMDCEDFLFHCQLERNNGDQALSRKFATLNNFFKTLIKKEYLVIFNPLDKLDKPKVRKKMRGHLTEDEMKRLFKYLEETNSLRDLCIISLLYASGIRLSELHQLNKNSLDFERKRFLVKGKGDKERICIFNDYAKANIIKYLETRNDDLEALFISRQNNRLSKRQIQVMIKKRIIESGTNKIMSTHNLRHSTAMALLHNDVPLDKIQIVLGHSNISTTQIYAHNNIDDVQSFVDGIL